jgi:hypothetical protein
VRELTGTRSGSSVPIKSKDGDILLTKEEQEQRWIEHFQEVLNQPPPSTVFSFTQEQICAQTQFETSDLSTTEVNKAIQVLKNNKAPGLDGIPAELLKHGKENIVEELTYLFNLIWQQEQMYT